MSAGQEICPLCENQLEGHARVVTGEKGGEAEMQRSGPDRDPCRDQTGPTGLRSVRSAYFQVRFHPDCDPDRDRTKSTGLRSVRSAYFLVRSGLVQINDITVWTDSSVWTHPRLDK